MSDDALHSPSLHFAGFARIADKQGRIVAPVPNVFELRAQAAYEFAQGLGRPVRLVGCTIRQVGKTTSFAHLLYHHCRRFAGTRAVVIADTDMKSERLFRIVQRLCEHDRYPWGHGHESTSTTIKWGNGSELVKRTAEAPRQTRGDTLQAVQLSECAYWRDVGPLAADETAAALLNALADHPLTYAAADSTPNGARGMFHSLWQGAGWVPLPGHPLADYHHRYPGAGGPDGESGSDWLRVFAAWWEFDECRRPGEAAGPLTERERHGVELYGWAWEQIAWRRWCIQNKCRGSESRFDEEYPEDPVSAWLVSGSPVFDSAGMSRLAELARQRRPEIGALASVHGGRSVAWVRGADGWAQVWEHPRPGLRYLIAVDPATGEEEVVGSGDRDRHSVLVLRAPYSDVSTGGTRYPLRLVARIAPPCLWDIGPLAAAVAQLSIYYGDCPVIVESNQGVGLIQRLRDEHKANLAHTDEFDRVTGRARRKIGWRATESSRNAALDVLQDLVRDQALDVECEHVVGELTTFGRTSAGRREALSGRHDDDVLALAIGVSCLGVATAAPSGTDVRVTEADAGVWVDA